jgi:hypothetical protein
MSLARINRDILGIPVEAVSLDSARVLSGFDA